MKEYILKDKIILATEKAYNIIYKEQGYAPFNSTNKAKKDVEASKKTKKWVIEGHYGFWKPIFNTRRI